LAEAVRPINNYPRVASFTICRVRVMKALQSFHENFHAQEMLWADNYFFSG